jgi:hypothetical protein
MPNAKGGTQGFTKQSNADKFVRHRDIKLKGSEQAKEDRIAKLMCEGICTKCRIKVQWRFQYDKYKSLTAPAKCAECMNKTVHKAYRTYCDPCATKRRACSSCNCNMDDDAKEQQIKAEKKEKKERELELKQQESAESALSSNLVSDMAMFEGKIKNDDNEEEGCVNVSAQTSLTETLTKIKNKVLKASDNGTASEVMKAVEEKSNSLIKTSGSDTLGYDTKSFQTIANNKYSKSRVVGAVEDVFTFVKPSIEKEINEDFNKEINK